MHRQVGDLRIEKGLAVRGLLIRHLVMPNKVAGSFKVIDFLAEQISPNTAINIMDQYRPCFKAMSTQKSTAVPLPMKSMKSANTPSKKASMLSLERFSSITLFA